MQTRPVQKLGDIVLNLKQTECWDYLDDRETTEALFGGGAGGGKSVLGCYRSVVNGLGLPGSRGCIGRKKLKALKESTLRTFIDVSDAISRKYNLGRFYKINNHENIIRFNNSTEIFMKDMFLYPADPEFDDLGSTEFTFGFIDECNQVVEKARSVLSSRLRYKLDEFDRLPELLLSCNPAKGWVYDQFYRPWTKGELPSHRKFVPALHSDNPNLSKYYIENLMRQDSATRKRLLEGLWDYDDDIWKWFPYEDCVLMFSNDHIATAEQLANWPTDDRYITVDVARLGSDSTIILVWKGWTVVECIRKDKLRTPEVKELIRQKMTEYGIKVRNVCIDEDGVGGGVVDLLPGCLGFLNGGKPIGDENYQTLKSQCYHKLSGKVQDNEIYIAKMRDTDREMLIQELDVVRQSKGDSDGKIAMEPKAMMKQLLGRSPDLADALMMRMRFTLKRFSGHTSIQ